MDVNTLISEMQFSLDDFQRKLNILRTTQTGHLYDVDVLLTRKEAASFIHKSLRHIDRLYAEGKLRREMCDGAPRFRKSELLRYLGLEINRVDHSTAEESLSEFEKIRRRYQ